MLKEMQNQNETNKEETQEAGENTVNRLDLPDSSQVEQDIKEESFVEKKARARLADAFDYYGGKEEAMPNIMRAVKEVLDNSLGEGNLSEETLQKIEKDLGACSDERERFVQESFQALAPIITLIEGHPELSEPINEREDFKHLTEALSYHMSQDGRSAFLHMLPDEKLNAIKLIRSTREGLIKMAEVVKDNENIEEINATSWIVADHPKLLERLGFKVDGEIDEATRRAHFGNETRKIFKASMSRNDFLEMYSSERARGL